MDEPIIAGCCCICDKKIFERGEHINGHRRARVVLRSGRYADYAICGECSFTPKAMASSYRRFVMSAKMNVERITEDARTVKARPKRQLEAITRWLADYASDPPMGLLGISAAPDSDTILRMERADG
jgi:hypothetical protein